MITASHRTLVALLLLVVLVVLSGFLSETTISRAYALQRDTQSVVFVTALNASASPDTTTERGLSHLAVVLRADGIRVSSVDTVDAIPETSGVIAVIGSLRALPVEAVARLYALSARTGAGLLFALDPDTEPVSGGLGSLLSDDYGITLQNATVIPPSFTLRTQTTLETAFMRVEADQRGGEITRDLVRYQIPVWTWRARPLTTDSIAQYTRAQPLLIRSRGIGKVGTLDSATLQTTLIGRDIAGVLQIAASSERLAVNGRSGGRVVVLGDSEMLLNGFGFALNPRTSRPLFAGNVLLARNAVRWLLDRPAVPENTDLVADIAGDLLDGFTWLNIDGDSAEWPPGLQSADDPTTDDIVPAAPYDLISARAFTDDNYLYIGLQTAANPALDTRVEIIFANGLSGSLNVTATGEGVIARSTAADSNTSTDISANTSANTLSVLIPEALNATGSGIEIRLPLRLFAGGRPRVDDLCVVRDGVAAQQAQSDCLGAPLVISTRDSFSAPNPLADQDGLLISVVTRTTAALRSAPDSASINLRNLYNGEMLLAIARNQVGNWIKVRDARSEGWIARDSVRWNGDVLLLPVLFGT